MVDALIASGWPPIVVRRRGVGAVLSAALMVGLGVAVLLGDGSSRAVLGGVVLAAVGVVSLAVLLWFRVEIDGGRMTVVQLWGSYTADCSTVRVSRERVVVARVDVANLVDDNGYERRLFLALFSGRQRRAVQGAIRSGAHPTGPGRRRR